MVASRRSSASFFGNSPLSGLFMGKAMSQPVEDGGVRAMYALVGDAITRWALLESHLLRLFAASLKLSIYDAANLLVHVKNFSLMFELVDAAIRIRHGNRSTARWASIAEFVRELSGDRNYIAHTPVMVHGRGNPNDPASWKPYTAVIGPAIVSFFSDARGRHPMDAAEIQEITCDIQQAIGFVLDIIDALDQEPPSPDILASRIERRRPPRTQRLANAPPPPKAPPRSSSS